MNILCKLLGHKISGLFYSDSKYIRYFRVKEGAIDGINRHHMQLYAECDRCSEKFHVGNIHGTPEGNVLK